MRRFFRRATVLSFSLAALAAFGCVPRFQTIDTAAVDGARLAFASAEPSSAQSGQRSPSSQRRPAPSSRAAADEEDSPPQDEAGKSVFIGELLAVFPGLFVHGLGHYYAGDYATSRRIRGMGEWGYLLTAIGGGLLIGGYFLDRSSEHILPISLYVSGGLTGLIGSIYFFSAWGCDLYDTPRAVRSGGKPWHFLIDDDLGSDLQ